MKRHAKKSAAADVCGFDILQRATRQLVDEATRALRCPTPLAADEIDRLLDVRPNAVAVVVGRFLARAGFSDDEVDALPSERLDAIARALLGTIGADHALAMIVAAEDEIAAAAPPSPPTRH